VSQAPPRFGTGTMFEPLPAQPFTNQAVDTVRRIVGSGIFELEVLVDRVTGEYWAIDLNPRGFGQMSLDIALGNDLPRHWYESVTGLDLGTPSLRTRPPAFWHDAVTSYLGFGVRFVRGPHRRAILDHALGRAGAPKVGVAFEWTDPMPGIVFSLGHLRHPRALLTQFLVDIELSSTPRDVVAAVGDARPWPDHSA
jgi:predicted ATP-grasp superfamily ATP-dependent carboligase